MTRCTSCVVCGRGDDEMRVRQQAKDRTTIIMGWKRRQLGKSTSANELQSNDFQATTTKRATASKHDRPNAKSQRALDQEIFGEASNFHLSCNTAATNTIVPHMKYGRTRQIKTPLLPLHPPCVFNGGALGLRFMTFGQQKA